MPEKKNKRVTFLIPPDLDMLLELLSDETGKAKNALVNEAFKTLLKKYKGALTKRSQELTKMAEGL